MSGKRYTLQEIDELRAAVLRKYNAERNFGSYHLPLPELSHKIEDEVRTYMLNGTRAEEILEDLQRRAIEKRLRHVRDVYSMFRLGAIQLPDSKAAKVRSYLDGDGRQRFAKGGIT